MGRTQAERQKRYYARLAAEGTCTICHKPRGREGLHCDACNGIKRQENAATKADVISHYGGKCKCCGETALVFLCMDHVDGKGAEHRNNHYPNRPGRGNGFSGSTFHRWLKKNNYPEGFQVLCWNCNSAKHILGVCPHQETQCQTQQKNTPSELSPTELTLTVSESL